MLFKEIIFGKIELDCFIVNKAPIKVEGGEATVESTMEFKTENITILDDWDKYNEMIELFLCNAYKWLISIKSQKESKTTIEKIIIINTNRFIMQICKSWT